MKNGFSFLVGIGLSATFLLMAQSCTKQNATAGSSSDSTTGTSTSSTSTTVAVWVDSSGTDSVYVIQDCGNGNYRDSIAASALPSVTTAYLDSSYSGYTALKTYQIKDSAGTVKGYVAIISYNGKPVALLFNADGTFAKVLEQREKGDMHGHRGYHNGGRYGNRDGHQRDTVALAALPSAITAYFVTNYPGDTLLKAYKNIDSSYLIISKDSVLYATLFSSDGAFISRTEIHTRHSEFASAVIADLPSAATAYLSTTYPSYVFDKGYSYSVDGTVAGYIVFIDANNSKYAVEFDASGNFVVAATLY